MGHRHSASASSIKLSVVIPTLNEASSVAASISSAKTAPGVEIIVVDGGSTDGTCGICKRHGAKMLSSARGRGRQLNTGWRAATGDWCVFLHGDSRLPDGYSELIDTAVRQASLHTSSPSVWGCFKTIETEFRNSFQGRVLSWGVELRTRLLRRPYGDQAIFVRRSTLQDLGGFKDWPLMEDVELVGRLNKVSAPAIVPMPLQTSGRRWEKLGFWQTCVLNQAILVCYALGTDVEKLALWYTQGRGMLQSRGS